MIPDLHLLEDRRVEHNAMYMLCPHDQPCLPLVLRCFLISAFFELEANVDFEVADAALFPLSVLEEVEFRAAFDDDFFVFFTRFAWKIVSVDRLPAEG